MYNLKLNNDRKGKKIENDLINDLDSNDEWMVDEEVNHTSNMTQLTSIIGSNGASSSCEMTDGEGDQTEVFEFDVSERGVTEDLESNEGEENLDLSSDDDEIWMMLSLIEFD